MYYFKATYMPFNDLYGSTKNYFQTQLKFPSMPYMVQ